MAAKRTGRPSKYTQELAEKICREITTKTHGLRKLCAENPDLPDDTTIRDWVKNNDDFSRQYARAKLTQADLMVEEILEIADDNARDSIIDEDGNVRYNGEWAARSRLRVDTRKWIASKLAPKIYGERQEVKHTLANHEESIKDLDK